MAESYSVKAILSAKDSGFSSTLKSCSSALDRIDNKISGFSFGMLSGAGQAAFNAITGSVTGLISEMDSSNAAWKTFDKNMRIIHGDTSDTGKIIDDVKGKLQDYAKKTVYSSSDMASTYAQLAAVGVKNTDKLVTGFGGLAAAAENPQQAMKTLSQQATQMAAKPSVAWSDFKLMMEQTPAGIAAVAKEMGMSTSDLVTKVQAGEVKTEKFFEAIQKVGNSDSFYKLATEAKTVGAAVDGLKETIGNKLNPAFELLTQTGIGAVNSIADRLNKLDVDKITTKISSALKNGEKYWNAFKEVASGVGKEVMEAFSAISSSFTDLTGAFGSAKSVDGFKGLLESVAAVIKKIADFATAHADKIAWLIANLPKIAIAIKGFKIASAVAPGVAMFASGIASIASKGLGGIAGKLFGVSKSQEQVGKTSSTSSKKMLQSAQAFALMGVAVLTIAAGFALLAYSAISLSNAGGLAIGVMAGLVVALAGIGIGMVALMKTLAPMAKKMMPVATAMLAMGAAVLLVSAGFALLALASVQVASAGGLAVGVMAGMVASIALLAAGAAALAPALTAGAVGLIAFGAAVVLVGVGAVLAGAALAIVASVLPMIVKHGAAGAAAISLLGAGMIAFAAGAALAGAAALVLGAGLTVAAVGITAVGVACVVAAAGLLALAAGALALGASLTVCGAAVTLLAGVMPLAASGALMVMGAFTGLMGVSALLAVSLLAVNVPLVTITATSLAATAGVAAFGAGMLVAAAGTLVMAAGLKAVSSQMKTISSSAKSAQKSLTSMQKSVKVVEAGLDALGSKAKSAFDGSAKQAQTAGINVGKNFATGMQSGLKSAVTNVMQAATQMQAVFTAAVKMGQNSGKQLGTGFVKGMQGGLKASRSVATSAVNSVNSAFRSGYSGAYSAGAYISMGFAAGMESQLGRIRSAAAKMAAAAEEAVRAKAKIASPSKVTTALGQFWGEGFSNGISDMARNAWKAAENLVSIPNLAMPNLAMAYAGEMSGEYSYYRDYNAIIEVPLSVDGKEFARATATYTQAELDRKQARDSRKHGRV